MLALRPIAMSARGSSGSRRRSPARGKRAALMPYLMGGYPDLDASRRIGEACAAAGADMLELGVPFSDPLADGPVIHAAATARAARPGRRVDGVLDVAAALAPLLPVVVMTYVNIAARARRRALPRAPRGAPA